MKDTLIKLRRELRPLYGDRETEAIIIEIFHFLKGWNRVDLIMHEDKPLSDFVKGEVDGILKRLLKHEPIQYITGNAHFYGMDLHVTPDVLIPRPETAELVDRIVDDADGASDLKVLDLCTGSGCIAIALARNLKFADVDALDVSEGVLKVARGNAEELKAQVRFIEADLLKLQPDGDAPLDWGKYDIIVSNPPYIDESEQSGMERNVLDYEPHLALFVPDDDPLRFYRAIALLAPHLLKPGGRIYLEINPRHADDLLKLFPGASIQRDSCNRSRFIIV